MESVTLPDGHVAMVDVISMAYSWPVKVSDAYSSKFLTALPPLSSSKDFARVLPNRAIKLTWAQENVEEVGLVSGLESLDLVKEEGTVIFWLARSNFNIGIILVIPLDRYWGPHACIPTVPVYREYVFIS